MKKIVINGKFYSDRMQGIVRFASEITAEIDRIIDNDYDVILALPCSAKNVPSFKNIKCETVGKRSGIVWEQTDLRHYLKKHRDYTPLNLCNIAPFFVQPGVTVIHDIIYKVRPDFYTSLRNKLSRMWHILQYRYIAKHERTVLTVSNYSKNEIERYYPKAKGKVSVVYNAWQHVLGYGENKDWNQKYSFLSKGSYFFTLATLAKNKNGRWIIETSKRNPDYTFVFAGKKYETEYSETPSNCHFVGFISDEDVSSLIKNCKAFIFPSIYEGFGLPPLEALALGADVISSDRTSLPEVLGRSVYYIDPFDYNVDINKLLKESVEKPEETLKRFSWEKSAEKVLSVF